MPVRPGFRVLPQVCQFCPLDICKAHRLRSCDQHWLFFLLRRSLGIIIALLLLAFTFTNLVIKPIEETGKTPQKMYTSAAPNENIGLANWTIVAVSKILWSK